MELLTHKFKLVSGVDAEVTELTGKQQRLLTQTIAKEDHSDRMDKMLASILVRVGSVTDVNQEFVKNMLIVDKKKALVMARQFAFDFEKKFTYVYDYLHNGESKKYEVEIDLNAEGMFPETPMEKTYKEYADIDIYRTIVLPRSKQEIRYRLLDGVGERLGASVKKADRSSHTILMMRSPSYFVPAKEDKKGEGTWVGLSMNALDDMNLKDISALKEDMEKSGGTINTTIKFTHPEYNEGQGSVNEVVTVDVLASVNFFFPSSTT